MFCSLSLRAIAKMDPEFDDAAWNIEVLPILKVEGIN